MMSLGDKEKENKEKSPGDMSFRPLAWNSSHGERCLAWAPPAAQLLTVLPHVPLLSTVLPPVPLLQAELEVLVKRLGGVTHQNPGASTTYLVAAQPSGHNYDIYARDNRQDIFTLAWLQECLEQGRLREQLPRHVWHLCAMVGGGWWAEMGWGGVL